MSYLWNELNNIFVDKGEKLEIRKLKERRFGKTSFMNDMVSNKFISGEIVDFIKEKWDGKTQVYHQYVIKCHQMVYLTTSPDKPISDRETVLTAFVFIVQSGRANTTQFFSILQPLCDSVPKHYPDRYLAIN